MKNPPPPAIMSSQSEERMLGSSLPQPDLSCTEDHKNISRNDVKRLHVVIMWKMPNLKQ